MENRDKIYKQFKDAASKVESKDFLAMDKVWGNIEGKLETKALKKEKKTWKKIAVAASILLVATFGYQLLKDVETEVIVPKESVVSSEIENKTAKDSIFSKEAVVKTEPRNPLIKKETGVILQHLSTKENVVISENPGIYSDTILQNPASRNSQNNERDDQVSGYFAKRKFNAISVKHYDKEVIESEKTEEAVFVQEKAPPLVVLDGKPLKSKNQNFFNNADVESVEYLDDPLYIINGVEYTEQELFGPNPTSPYYPLNKQEITSTTIFQGESATNLYGEKGKKGVVIITTKNGKSLKK